jgi:hypothetical protein
MLKAGVTEKQHKDVAECPQLQPAEFRPGDLIFDKTAFFKVQSVSCLIFEF